MIFKEKESEVAQSCPTLQPMDCSLPDSSVHGFSRQEYWSRLPFPSPGNLPDPGIKPMSAALQADSLPSEPPGKIKRKQKFSFDFQKETEILIVNLTIFHTRSHGVPGISVFLTCKLL